MREKTIIPLEINDSENSPLKNGQNKKFHLKLHGKNS